MNSSGASSADGAAAASSIARPPSAWTLTIAAPEPAAAATARSTVAGMSWSFRSRKTREPACGDVADDRGTLGDERLEADLEPRGAGREALRRRQDFLPGREVERDADLLARAHPSAPSSSTGAPAWRARPTSDEAGLPRASQYAASSSTRRPETPGSLKFAVPTWTADGSRREELQDVRELRDPADSHQRERPAGRGPPGRPSGRRAAGSPGRRARPCRRRSAASPSPGRSPSRRTC